MKKMDSATKYGILFALIYMVSYLTRTNFGAIVSEMERSTGYSKDLLSLALTGSFVTYSVGQVISGFIGDRISPKTLISIGLGITAGMNLLLPLCQSVLAIQLVWCVNGFAQSLMWPPVVKMMSELLNEEEYKRSMTLVSWGSSGGTILVYLLAPVVILLWGWTWVFILCAGCAVVALVLWQRISYNPQQRAAVEAEQKEPKRNVKILLAPWMLGIMGAIVLQGMLRDGVTTWMPSYIAETYQLSTASAILTGVIMPVFSIVCHQSAAVLYRKRITNPLVCAGVFFGFGALFAAVLYVATGRSAVMSVACSAVLTGCMHGVNMMLISMLPRYFKRYGIASTASGVLNACTYVGSALSTYGIAVLSQGLGWKGTILIWVVIAVLGTAACVVCVKPWKKHFG